MLRVRNGQRCAATSARRLVELLEGRHRWLWSASTMDAGLSDAWLTSYDLDESGKHCEVMVDEGEMVGYEKPRYLV